MDYMYALNWANKFIIESGIREYCKEHCKGKCCSGSLKHGKCTEKIKCGDKLACVAFLCGELKNLMRSILTEKQTKLLVDFSYHIAQSMRGKDEYFGNYSIIEAKKLPILNTSNKSPTLPRISYKKREEIKEVLNLIRHHKIKKHDIQFFIKYRNCFKEVT